MTRRLAILLAVVVVAAGCGNSELGRRVPGCPADPDSFSSITSGIIMQMQAVETAEYVPCLNELNAGWSYEDLVAESGKSRFWLDSDRSGSRFLEVTLRPQCEVGTAPQTGTAANGSVAEYRQVELVGSNATVVLVPVTGREMAYAAIIESELEARSINGRDIFVVLDDGDTPLTDKVTIAAGQNRPIVLVDEQDALAQTASLQMPGETQSTRGLDLDGLLDRLDRLLPKPSFTGQWFQVFAGGCITYEFDASGAGVDRLAEDVEDAIGLFPAGELWRLLRSQGVVG
ncbi:MAG: hypothetical protein OER12_02265 [Acidimicrobiia bacterium]|nr:hypothetical protein [Acidimicrobiia bacterium]